MLWTFFALHFLSHEENMAGWYTNMEPSSVMCYVIFNINANTFSLFAARCPEHWSFLLCTRDESAVMFTLSN